MNREVRWYFAVALCVCAGLFALHSLNDYVVSKQVEKISRGYEMAGFETAAKQPVPDPNIN